MSLSPYDQMQKTVDIVGASPHPTNKIAATLAGVDKDGKDFSVSYNNYWPDPIRKNIGTEVKIGNASGTLHAETACVIHSPGPTNDSAVFVTDLPCPNCVKNLAEAGIKSLYIDHKGFDKDYAQRRGHHFSNMSMRICEKAGISVYKIFRKDRKLESILEIPADYAPPVEKPPHFERVMSAESFNIAVKKERLRYGDRAYAVALAADHENKLFLLSAEPHPVIGYTSDTMEEPEDKYSFILQPVNRLIMTAARKGLRIQNGRLYSSIVPTARELVNVVGLGLTSIAIGDPHAARDQFGPMAVAQMEKAGILNVQQ